MPKYGLRNRKEKYTLIVYVRKEGEYGLRNRFRPCNKHGNKRSEFDDLFLKK